VIASHYAEPVQRIVAHPTALRSQPSENAEIIRQVGTGEPFALIEDSVGWAWGYAGEERRVGYVSSEALAPLS
jgi:hypothetical protein